ncbi:MULTISPECIES: hypothetical protein [Methylobacterium]|uniref:hypothetical protein n=1 Tax=Methylobacterium TaxID=407 RepID=UPI002F353AAC
MPGSRFGPGTAATIDFPKDRISGSAPEPPTLRPSEILADAIEQATQEKTGRSGGLAGLVGHDRPDRPRGRAFGRAARLISGRRSGSNTG